jgi:RNA polymerase sigma factor (sigma-70 family)
VASFDQVAEWVEQAQAGDDIAFTELVRAFQDMAVAYANSILRDYQLAEDAAQEAFVDAHRQLNSLREPITFPAWFRTIVFKYCDRLKRRRHHLTADLDQAGEIAAQDPNPHEVLESSSVESLVRQTIDALPEAERTAVMLHYMADESHIAIGEFLGVTPNTIKTRLYAARKRMRNQLADQVEEFLQAGKASRKGQFLHRILSATLVVQVYEVDRDGIPRTTGSTFGLRRPEIPRSPLWFVEPRQQLVGKDSDTFLELAKRIKAPGIAVPNQATDELLERISRLEHVVYLDFQGSVGVTDSGIRHLARLSRLQHLDLSSTGITDSGLSVLQQLPQLKTLELRHHPGISDSGMQNVGVCTRLERVNVMGTPTGDGTVEALAGKPRLREFWAGTAITDLGLAALHLFPAFKTWAHGHPRMGLMDFRAQPNYLWLNLKAPITNEGLANLTGLAGLTALNLFGNEGHAPFDSSRSSINASGLAHLRGLSNLQWLGCCAQICSDEAMEEFGKLPQLRFLMCQDTVAGDAGFTALAQSKSIEYIWGRRCHRLASAGFASMARMPKLRGLAVSCRNVENFAFAMLPLFPELREFMPIDVEDADFRQVAACGQLQSLYCMYCPNISDQAMSALRDSPRLTFLGIWGSSITDEGLQFLNQIASLRRVRLSGISAVTDAGVAHLAALPRLNQLDLERLPNVTAESIFAFPTNVRVNFLP